jgi:prephenate dehydrogenase
VDRVTSNLQEAVRGADLIVFCTPLAQMSSLARSFAGGVEKGAFVTDVGSVKGALVRDLEPLFREHGAIFVGSHPMAGSEKMGVSAAREDLFERAACVVTPTPGTPEPALLRIEALWRGVGAIPFRLAPQIHDEIVSRSSHLPHVLAAHLASYVLNPASPPEQGRLCANGFKDCTRIAAGSPEMWRDIMLMNKGPIIEAIQEFSLSLSHFTEILEAGDPDRIENFFRKAKSLREGWAAAATARSPE